MTQETAMRLSTKVLDAWNRHDIDAVLACYTPDCVYLDPNTRGPVVGHEALRRYLTRLFEKWRMHWSMREFFPFGDSESGAFLWHATLTPAAGGNTAEINGIDLAVVRGNLLYRNEVYFDRMALFGAA